MAFQSITFDEDRFDAFDGVEFSSAPGQNNGFLDVTSASNPDGTGAIFAISNGTMNLAQSGANRFLAFFPFITGGQTSNAKLLVRFAARQKVIRFRLTSDFIGADGFPVLVQFFADPDHVDPPLESRTFSFGDLPAIVDFISPVQGAADVLISTRSAENTLDDLEFSDTVPTSVRDVALAFDGSGSMAAAGKWGAMIEAGDLFRDLYEVMGDPDDTFGGILFRWNCPQTNGGSLNVEKPSLAPLSAAVDIPALFAADAPGGCTPIGQGLLDAAAMVNAGPNVQKSILLFTDGINNRGPTVAAAASNSSLNGVTVHCIGLGSGSDINPVEITQVTADQGGIYRETTSASEILDFFSQTLAEILGKAELAEVTGDDVVIATGTTKAIFLVAWAAGAPAADFNLRAPDGTVFNFPSPIPAGLVSSIRYQPGSSTSLHGYYVVEGADLAGTWRFQNVPAGAQRLAIEDLALRVKWSVSPKVGMTGAPIRLQARITENGKPLRGKAQISVRVSSPQDSIGDFLALGGKNLGRRPTGADASLRSAVAASALKAKGWKRFPKPTSRDLALRQAGPGVYELEFDNTANDGVYRFDLKAQSVSGGTVFRRRATLFSVLVGRPSANESAVAMTSLGNGLYQVRFTPATKAKRALGPFLSSTLRLRAGDGKVVGPMTDNLDGSYTQSIAWDGPGLPALYIELLGKSFSLAKPKLEKRRSRRKRTK